MNNFCYGTVHGSVNGSPKRCALKMKEIIISIKDLHFDTNKGLKLSILLFCESVN